MTTKLHFSTIQSNGRELAAGVAGEGPPLVLIPGICMSHTRWLDVGYVDALAQQFTVICLDPLGHGRSERCDRAEEYHPDRVAAHVLDAIDALGFDQVFGWGYSRGANILDRVAVAAPQRFERLALGGIPLFDVRAALEALGIAAPTAEIEASYHRAIAGDWAGFWERFPLPLADDVKAEMEGRNDVASVAAASLATVHHPWQFQTPLIPTLAYWGAGEIFHDLNVAEAAKEEHSSLRTAAVSGGHAEAFRTLETALDLVVPFLLSDGA